MPRACVPTPAPCGGMPESTNMLRNSTAFVQVEGQAPLWSLGVFCPDPLGVPRVCLKPWSCGLFCPPVCAPRSKHSNNDVKLARKSSTSANLGGQCGAAGSLAAGDGQSAIAHRRIAIRPERWASGAAQSKAHIRCCFRISDQFRITFGGSCWTECGPKLDHFGASQTRSNLGQIRSRSPKVRQSTGKFALRT